jgi:deazaflavin-dependent oxidoreductase (nitroreductase family)
VSLESVGQQISLVHSVTSLRSPSVNQLTNATSPDVTGGPTMTHAPALVRRSNPLARRLLRIGMPMGPNVLLTVRGRTSGEPRTAPVAIVEVDGRRWVIGAYGEVQWVRNLRAAGEAEIELRGRRERVRATELDREAAAAFYRDRLRPYVARLPPLGRLFARGLFAMVGADVLRDPEAAAATRPVFELHRVSAADG